MLSDFVENVLKKFLKSHLSILKFNIIPNHHFWFRHRHSTIQQCHLVVDVLSFSLKKKECDSFVFLNFKQAFDRAWHPNLLCKLKGIFPFTNYLMLKSFLTNGYFCMKVSLSLLLTMPKWMLHKEVSLVTSYAKWTQRKSLSIKKLSFLLMQILLQLFLFTEVQQ